MCMDVLLLVLMHVWTRVAFYCKVDHAISTFCPIILSLESFCSHRNDFWDHDLFYCVTYKIFWTTWYS
uniref:Secreted protein n=1 Tax=Setaria viridis TaxID=4556 RepID=A0A4V6DAQ2_SETVI|nr:hypothetical protein SEVIR_2G075450v2 [Setaria viridis]